MEIVKYTGNIPKKSDWIVYQVPPTAQYILGFTGNIYP